MSRPISIGYKCRCMSREVECGVRGRLIGESTKAYIEGAIRLAISADHRKRSPGCQALITEHVALPFDVNEPIDEVRPAGVRLQ